MKEGLEKLYDNGGKLGLELNAFNDKDESGVCYKKDGSQSYFTAEEIANFNKGLGAQCE